MVGLFILLCSVIQNNSDPGISSTFLLSIWGGGGQSRASYIVSILQACSLSRGSALVPVVCKVNFDFLKSVIIWITTSLEFMTLLHQASVSCTVSYKSNFARSFSLKCSKKILTRVMNITYLQIVFLCQFYTWKGGIIIIICNRK